MHVRLPEVGTQCMSDYLRWAHSACQVTSGGHTVHVPVWAMRWNTYASYVRFRY